MNKGFHTFIFDMKPAGQLWLIAISGLVFFLPFLGSVHLFDWDEINFAESAREMIVTGDYFRVQIDYHPFWEKPPLFFWLQALSMKLLGIHEYAARLPNAIIGVITLLTFYAIGKKVFNKTFGMIWALLYLGSFLPHLYFKSGIIDPVFNYFIFVSIYFLFRSVEHKEETKSTRYVILAGLFNGLAILTKGPVGLLILLLTFLIYWLSVGFKRIIRLRNILFFSITILAVTFFWYGFETIRHGPSFIIKFIQYQIELFSQPVAGHEQPFYYHFVVVLLGCFPLSVFALGAFFSRAKAHKHPYMKWMICLFWVVMILFSIVTTKIVHYSSMAYPPLAFLAACFIDRLIHRECKLKKYFIYMLLGFGTVFSIILTLLPVAMYHKELIYPYINDPFAVASLQVDVFWSGYEFIIGAVYWVLIVWGIILLKKGAFKKSLLVICYSTALCMFLYTALIIPKIEAHSQRSMIEFCKELKGRDVYITTVGFKSYAHYFYAQRPGNQRPERNNLNWLVNGPIDKPAFFIAKIQHKSRMDSYQNLRQTGMKGGFLFYRRDPE